MFSDLSEHRKRYGMPENDNSNSKFTIFVIFLIILLIIKNLLQ